jgi:predicted DNA-binding transcriptional regulator AlpA
MTAKDLEALLKIDVKTIYSYVQRGLIPYVRIQSNVRFSKRQILDWLAEHTYQPRSAALKGSEGPRPLRSGAFFFLEAAGLRADALALDKRKCFPLQTSA